MTIQKGRDIIDQMDADMQLQAELSARRGQEGQAQLRERRCSLCWQPGHNSRTYEIVIEISEEEESD